MYNRTTTQITTPSAAPVQVQAQLTPQRLIMASAMALGGALLTAGGGAIFAAQLDADISYRSGWQWALMIAGAGVGLFGVAAMILGLWIVISDVREEREQRQAWNDQLLFEREQGMGVTTAVQVSETQYSSDVPSRVLLALLWLYLSNVKAPSIRTLAGPQFLTFGHRSFRVLDFTEDGAGEFLDILDRAGVITGRGPRKAGSLALVDFRQAAQAVGRVVASRPTVATERSEE